MTGHVCAAGLLDIEDVEDFDRAEEDSVVSWEVMSTLRMKELQAVAEQFLEQKQVQNLPKDKLVLASKLASHDIDVEQFSAFLEGFRGNRTKPSRKKSKRRKEEVKRLVLVGTRSGRFKGGKSKGNWFVAERVGSTNKFKVHAWNTHHRGRILFSRVYYPSWTDSRDGKETFQSTKPHPEEFFTKSLYEIERTQIKDTFEMVKGVISLVTISRWKLR